MIGYLQEKNNFYKEVKMLFSSQKLKVSPSIISRPQVQALLFSRQLCCKGSSGSSVMHRPSLGELHPGEPETL